MEEPSLDSIVDAFRHGEFLRRSAGVRTASAEEVYGAIAHYLANDAEVDAYLIRQNEKWARTAEPLPANLRER